MRFYTNFHLAGNNVLLKEVDNGVRKKYKVNYQPTLYVPGNSNSSFHTLLGEPVEPLQFENVREARNFVTQNEGVPNYQIYGNTMYGYAFIGDTYPESEITYDLKQLVIGTLDIENESEQGFSQDAAQRADDRVNVITLKLFGVDQYHVFTFNDGGIYNPSNRFKPTTKNVKHYEYETEEEMLQGFLKVWRKIDLDILTGWNVRFYDVPYLYNRIAKLLGEDQAKKLSPWDIVQQTTVVFMNSDRHVCELAGISTLDYLQIYKKIVMDPRENYKLDFIAKVELDEGKIDWREKYDSLREFYHKDFQGFVEYNIQDVKLPDMLEAKLKLIEQIVSVSYLAKVNYIDVLAQTRTWDMLIYNWLKLENIVIPQKEFQEKTEQFVGAYVKDPIPGMYHNVVAFDVASLYPNLIRILNIGLETKMSPLQIQIAVEDFLKETFKWTEAFERAKENNCTVSANGIFYSRKKESFYSRMIDTLFTNRKKYQATIKAAKKELESCTDEVKKTELSNTISKFDVKQKATKIMMNSLYGAFGSQYFRFYDLENAVAVTATGQFVIQYIQKGLNAYLNKLFKTEKEDFVIYSDTDSVYVCLDKLVKKVFENKPKPTTEKLVKFLDNVCKEKIEPEIDRLFQIITTQLINGMNPDKAILSMKREVIADRGIWSSKKHYILNVWNSEGDNYFECDDCHNKFSGPSEVAPPCNKCKSPNTKRVAKLKIMGFDMVKSSLPQFSKDTMKKAVNLVMTATQDELAEFIEASRLKFMSLPVEDIAFPRGANNLDKWEDAEDTYTKGTPIHVKGVLLFNETLKNLGLHTKYAPIASSEKIKFVYLKQPNPIHDKVIAFNGALPKEFGLHKYVDYQDMYESTIIKPLGKILDPIGWSTEKTFDMDKFFK
jgi:DNA polymerase elongation subunit (family B)